MAPARFLQRFCATAVDSCLGLGLALVAAVTVARHFNPRTFGPRDDWLIGPGDAALDVALLAAWLYYAGCERSPWQATLGKRLLGVAVTDLNGERLSFLRTSARYFAKLLSALLLLVGYLIRPFTRRKQALHDMISGSVVVQAREVVRRPLESIRLATIG